MNRIRAVSSFLVLLALLASTVGTLGAQEAPLRPLSEYLDRSAVDAGETLRYAAQRCSALFSLVVDERRRRGDEGTAEMYLHWSLGFAVHATTMALITGAGADEALRLSQEGITHLRGILSERAARNVYIADDPVLSSDVRTCRDLVDELEL